MNKPNHDRLFWHRQVGKKHILTPIGTSKTAQPIELTHHEIAQHCLWMDAGYQTHADNKTWLSGHELIALINSTDQPPEGWLKSPKGERTSRGRSID